MPWPTMTPTSSFRHLVAWASGPFFFEGAFRITYTVFWGVPCDDNSILYPKTLF